MARSEASLFSSGQWLLPPALGTKSKVYTVGTKRMGIGQLHSTNSKQLADLEQELIPFMQENFASFGVDIYFMLKQA